MSAMTSNFGGKKAAPFRKGGKPRKTIVAKAVVAKAKRAKREMALSVITGREIDLGRDGSKWKHGWIPLNASAAALKAHKGGGHNAVGSREEHAAALTKHIKEASSKSRAANEPGNWYDTPTHTSPSGRTASIGVSHSDGKAYYGSTVTTAGGERMHVRHNSAKAAHEHVMNALYPSNVTSINRRDRESQARMTGGAGDQFRTPAAEDMFRARATTAQKRLAVQKSMGSTGGDVPKARLQIREGAYRGESGHHIRGKDTHGRSTHVFIPGDRSEAEKARDRIKAGKNAFEPKPSIQNHSQMSPQDKIDAVEKMHGTGSKQHLAALAKHGTESQKRAAAYQVRESNPATRTTGTQGKEATELKPKRVTKNTPLTSDEKANITEFGRKAMDKAMKEKGMTEREAYRWISGGPRFTRPGQRPMRNGRYL